MNEPLVQSNFSLQIVALPFSQAVELVTIHMKQFAEIFIAQMMLQTTRHCWISVRQWRRVHLANQSINQSFLY